MTPKVHDEWKTLELVRDKHMSIARFGDGEFKLCDGRNQISQLPNEALQTKLNNILHSNNKSLLVCIPNIHDENIFSLMSEQKQKFWKNYLGDKTLNFLREYKEYGSSFITRPDSAPGINKDDYWKGWQSVWADKRVLLVDGVQSRFNKAGPLDNTSYLNNIKCSSNNAFNYYDEILFSIDSHCTAEAIDLVVLSLGPTATVLAADLNGKGIWALDLGRFGVFYAKWKYAQVKESEVPQKRKFTIFSSKTKTGIRANKEGSKRTICDVNLRLANIIASIDNIKEDDRRELLEYVDELYDMGKRMGIKLRDYHDKFNLQGGWRDDL